ncbi:MAG: type II toxin-antitoxin system RelE/ParE family toxin [Acidobacteria bacterium]|nr:type II toxin-antitoxin system RelE/ParE family toxin [Acidobacteriota bacterium]
MTSRKSARHPRAERVEVRFTKWAVEDLRDLQRINPSAVLIVAAKIEMIQRNPEVGEPLRGALAGFRKLAVQNRQLRIIWRVTWEDGGTAIVDIAEIWAVGHRRDNVVYRVMDKRAKETGD